MVFKRIRKTIEARVQNLEAKKFEKTTYGKKLSLLKDCHKGEKCFIIGNGPSLDVKDLDRIYEKGMISFATNRVFKIFEKTKWRPTYYASEDILLMQDAQKVIEEMNVKGRFIPINLKWYEGIDIPNADYFYIEYQDPMKETYGLSLDIPHNIRCRGTVTITCLQLAIYMGFSEIYLIGVDLGFGRMIEKQGNVVIDNTIKNHFAEDYDKGIFDQGFHVDEATEAYMDVENLSRKLRTFKVYNATRGGKLEVYERVDVDSILNN